MAKMRKKLGKALGLCLEKPSRIGKGICLLLTQGPAAVMREAYQVAARADNPKNKKYPQPDYAAWYRKQELSEGEKRRQRSTEFPYRPKISILISGGTEAEPLMAASRASLEEQTYGSWELLPAEQAAAAEGEYIGFLEAGDRLAADALFACVKAWNEDRTIDMLYTDEDEISGADGTHRGPRLKPDFNFDLLCSMNYIGHFLVLHRDLLAKLGKWTPRPESGWEYDLILRASEQAGRIFHIPRILYHAREGKPELPAEAGRQAVQAHYERLGIPAEALPGKKPGLYRARFHWTEQPLISILIPNKDHIGDLDLCIRSIEERSSYRNYEYIIIENNSTEPETFRYYEELEARLPQARVVRYDGDFNFSAINNFGASFAKGEYFLLLNNDTEIINADCLEQLLGYCMREDVGAVGARLFYPDDTIQHAGVVIGFGSLAGHAFVGAGREEDGYLSRIVCAQEYSAVTAACLMVKRSVFEAVGGLTPELKVAFNDTDFCMKIQELGKRVVYNPEAQLYHYESKSRGIEDSPEKVARFNYEVEFFQKRWPEIVAKGDPCYNPNLSLERPDFALAVGRRHRQGK